MDNYDLSNLPPSGHCADSGEHHSRLTDEENRRAIFSGRSATVSRSEQVEQKQLPSTGDEQIPEQRVLANFDISSASTTPTARVTTVDESEDPFAALAAYAARASYQLLTSNDDKRSGKRRAPKPRNVVIGDLPESVINESSSRPDRSTGKRQKPDSTDTQFLPLPREAATESQAATMPDKSATSRKITKRQDPDESLRKRVKEETNKWIVECKDSSAGKRFMCGYPGCGWIFSARRNLKVHIFRHTQISLYRCTYPECTDNPYFDSSSSLTRHVQSYHKKEQPYHCTLCHKRFRSSDSYKRHMRSIHKIAV